MWKGCAFAFACRNALFACLLAAEGLTGPSPLFEGEMGFMQQVSGPIALERLGGPAAEDWMLPRASIKCYPAEYHSQSAIAAALVLRPRIGDPRRIRAVAIDTCRAAVEIIAVDPEKWRPTTRETADHSLPYCVAAALLDGEVTAAQFTPERLADPAILDLMSRISITEHRPFTARYRGMVANRVGVLLDDGTGLVEEVAFPPGHERNPLSDEQLVAKYHTMADPLLGPQRADEVRDLVDQLETLEAPSRILRSLARSVR
jgi:2-methylcitrate dehydratase